MKRQIKSVDVTHVSFVDKAANQRNFFLTKSEKQGNFETVVRPVIKSGDPQQLVYGVVYEPDVEDSHGDFMKADAIEKAAHGFMENYQQIDKQHDFETHAGKVVESYIAPVDMVIEKETITKGTWVLVTKATDDIWESIQKGEFTGYSLAGNAEVEEVKKATTAIFNKTKVGRDISSAIDAFNSATWRIRDDYQMDNESKVTEIQSEITELSNLIGGLGMVKQNKQGNGLIETVKSFFSTKKTESKGDEMNKEELQEVLKEAFGPISDRLDKLEKGETVEPEVKPEDKTDEPEDLVAAVKAAIEPITDRLEKLEKSRQSNVVEPTYQEQEAVKKNAVPNYVDAVFPIEE